MASIPLLTALSGAMTPLFGLWPFRWSQSAADAPLLVGQRVELRWPRSQDHAAWACLRAESRAFLTPWEPAWPNDALTVEGFERRLRAHRRDVRDGTGYMFLVFRRDDGALLGGVSLSQVRRGAGASAEIGYWLGEAHGGRGYMSEAVQAVLRHAFETLQLRRVEAACLPSNVRSKALLVRLGFQREGLARSYLCINGRWRDHELHALLLEDWRQMPAPVPIAAGLAAASTQSNVGGGVATLR
ncbi:GNAT family N-acetyltransferase [Marinibaculum pumilum]|uniref:GNAT family N-acetyltransferase n=1 Tax=Marinibaculum pumilum TaxID=1766165 RepID=A0ABV7KWH7_9PROT